MICNQAQNITGSVNGQVLTIAQPVIASDSVDYLTARFSFSEDWTGADKFAFFAKAGHEDEPAEVPLTDDGIAESQHLNLTAGRWNVWLVGLRTEGAEVTQRITTTVAEIRVQLSGVRNAEPFPGEAGSAGEQIVAQAIAARNAAQTAAGTATDAALYASASVSAAAGSAAAAEQSANAAAGSATTAGQSATAAQNAQTAADAAANAAAEAAVSAAMSEDTAQEYAENAEASAQTAAANANSTLGYKNGAVAAKNGAITAQTAAEAAQTAAETASTTAEAAQTAADAAANAANAAAYFAARSENNAQEYAENAEARAQTAAAYANSALVYKNDAVAAKNAAVDAKEYIEGVVIDIGEWYHYNHTSDATYSANFLKTGSTINNWSDATAMRSSVSTVRTVGDDLYIFAFGYKWTRDSMAMLPMEVSSTVEQLYRRFLINDKVVTYGVRESFTKDIFVVSFGYTQGEWFYTNTRMDGSKIEVYWNDGSLDFSSFVVRYSNAATPYADDVNLDDDTLKAIQSKLDISTKLSELDTDTEHRTVTDAEKAIWNSQSAPLTSNLLKGDGRGGMIEATPSRDYVDYNRDVSLSMVKSSYTLTSRTNFSVLAGDTTKIGGGTLLLKGYQKIETETPEIELTAPEIKIESPSATLNGVDIATVDDIPTSLSNLSDDADHRTVTDDEKSDWNAKYAKPVSGIPQEDLASAVQASLEKADSAPAPTAYITYADEASVNITLADNTEYTITNCASITLAYPTGRYEAFISVTFGTDVSLTFPAGTKYIGDVPTFAAGETWEISVKNGVVVAGKVGN